jgi:hypothetical protein
MRGRAAETRLMKVDLPTLGKPEQADVGDQLQLEAQAELLAWEAGLRVARRLIGGALEVGVAAAAAATAGDDNARARFGEIGDDLAGVGVADDGAERHLRHDVVAAVAVLILAAAVLAALRRQERLILEVEQRGHAEVDLEDDVAAITAIAAVRPALFLVLLVQEAEAAGAAVAAGDFDLGLVDESHDSNPGAGA